jgi:large subunit ribosomal protein L25
MNVVPLNAETGRETGSATSRRLRREGKVPATVYGRGTDVVSVAVSRAELRKALTTAAGINALIELTYDGGSHYTLVKDLQRHPVRRDPLHVDFQRVDPEKPMELSVPITLVGDAKKVTSNGGRIEHVLHELAVSVRPDSIPNEFKLDLSDLEVDQTLTVEDLKLPAGVDTEIEPDTVIVTAHLTRAAILASKGISADEDTDLMSEAEIEAASEAAEAAEAEG